MKVREREAPVLSEPLVEDVRGHLYAEHRDEAVSGFMVPSLSRRIDRVHLSSKLLSFVWSVYTAATPACRVAVVVQAGPPEEAGLPPISISTGHALVLWWYGAVALYLEALG